MSDLDEIGVYRPDQTAAVLTNGQRLTQRDLRNLKGHPDPNLRALVSWVHQIERNEKMLARYRAR